MELFFAFFFWMLIFMLVVLFFHRRVIRIIEAERQALAEEKESVVKIDYKTRYRVMNDSEASFYFLLKEQLGEKFLIFPKIRIADVLETVNGKGYYQRRNKILSRHIDFLICDIRFRPLIAIELDGGYHRSLKQMQSDELKNHAFNNANFPIKRIIVGTDFQREIESLNILLNS